MFLEAHMRISRATSLFFVLAFIVSHSAPARAQTNQTTLQPGTPIERTIGSSESHTYVINLSENQYLQFVVNQHGIDLIVRVFSPTGKGLGDFDTPNGAEGPENVAIVGITSGAYRIVVSALNPNAPSESGRYEIKTIEIRDATDQELKVAQNEEARRAKGLELLNTLLDSIPEIRLPQTKIRLKLQGATLLWDIDEKKALKLLTEAVTDSRDYLQSMKTDDDSYDQAFGWARQIRFEGVQTLATHDPEAALSLMRSTRRPADAEGYGDEDNTERQFELALASQISDKNPQRAFELAEESLKDGLSQTLPQTLQSLSRKNQDLARNLSKDITAKLLNQKLLNAPEAAEVAMNLVGIASNRSRSDGSRSLNTTFITDADFRALVQKIFSEASSTTNVSGQEVLQRSMAMGSTAFFEGPLLMNGSQTRERMLQTLKEMGPDLDTIVPGGSSTVEKSLKTFHPEGNFAKLSEDYENKINNASPDEARELIAKAPVQMRSQLVQRFADRNVRSGNWVQARHLLIENLANPREQRRAINNLEREAAYADASQGKMDDALKHVGKISDLRERAELISELASRIGPGQKRASAVNLLEIARSLLGTSIQAEGLPQMNALLQLAAAFARYDGKRGFEIVDPLVDQFNELAEAAKALNGFGPDYFVDGELSLQNGNSLANIAVPMSRALGILSLNDFDQAKRTADKLQLPEIRLSVQLGIAQQAIKPDGVYSPSAAYVNSLNR